MSPIFCFPICSRRLGVRTADFHSANRSSNLRGSTLRFSKEILKIIWHLQKVNLFLSILENEKYETPN